MRTRLLLSTYVALIALRDVLIELALTEEESVAVAWTISACVLAAAIALLAARRGLGSFAAKLRSPAIALRLLVLGCMAVAIYVVTCTLVRADMLGAGLFNCIDFGLAPLCIACVGIVFRKERPGLSLWIALGIYCIGVCLLLSPQWTIREPGGRLLLLVGVALSSPIFTGLSDGLSQHLLNDRGLNRAELMAGRFAVPVLVLGAWQLAHARSCLPQHVLTAVGIGLVCATVPLLLFYGILVHQQLVRISVWETLIPLVAYLATLHAHPEHLGALPLAGLLAIVGGYLLYELMWLERWGLR